LKESYILPNQLKIIQPVLYGYEQLTPGNGIPPHIRDIYLIHYVMHGKGIYQTGGETYYLKEDDCFIIRPGEQVYYHASTEDPWSYVWIGFSSNSPLEFSKLIFHQPILRGLFQQVRELPNDSAQIGKLTSLMYEIVWILEEKTNNFSPENYAEYAKIWMDTNYYLKLKLEEIAKILHIGPNYLYRCFKEKYEISPKEYLTSLRLNKAKEFLKLGYSVSLSASMAGFQDLPNFSKQYKKTFGNSPKNE